MFRVIERDPILLCTCKCCKCEFSYMAYDWKEYLDKEDNTYKYGITCPMCNTIIFSPIYELYKEIEKKRKQDVYNKKIGSIVKSYRLNKDLVKHFKIACDKVRISQSAQLTKMMTEFINKVNIQNKE